MRNDRVIILADFEAIFYRSLIATIELCDIALSPNFYKLINKIIGLLPENKEIHLVLFSKQPMTEENIGIHNALYFLNDVIGFLKSTKFNNSVQVGCFLKTLSTSFDFSAFSDFSAYQHDINFTETELKTELKQALVISDNHEILEKALNMAHRTIFISEKIVNPGELFLIHYHSAKNFIRKNCNSAHQVLLSIDFDNTLARKDYGINSAIIDLIAQYAYLKNTAGFELNHVITTARSLDRENALPKKSLLSIKNFVDRFHEILPLNYDDTIFLGHLPATSPEQPVWGQAKAFVLLERLINNPNLRIIHVDDEPEEKKFFDFLKEYVAGKWSLSNVIAAINGFGYPINSGEREKTIALFQSTSKEVMFDAINRLHFIQVCVEKAVYQTMIEYSHAIEEWTAPYTPLALQLSRTSSCCSSFFESPREYEPIELDDPGNTDQSCTSSVLPVNK